jgi:hypothetical protein
MCEHGVRGACSLVVMEPTTLGVVNYTSGIARRGTTVPKRIVLPV